MERQINRIAEDYRRNQDMFEAALCSIILRPERRTEFESLLGDWRTTISPFNYERAAQLAHRDKGWRPQRRLMVLLLDIIRDRETVHDWNLRWRHADIAVNLSNHNMLEVLKRTYAILNHDKVYEGLEAEPHRGPAVQAAPGQLPLPLPQQQLPAEVVQPMRTDDEALELQLARVRRWESCVTYLSPSPPLSPTKPTTQPVHEGATQTARGATTASALEETGDLGAILPTYNLNTHAVSVRTRQIDNGQLPLPLFSTIPTAQPTSEGATQSAGEATTAVSQEEQAAEAPQQTSHVTAASSPDREETEETEDSAVDDSTYELNTPMNASTRRRIDRYHRHQRVFVEAFLFTPVAARDELEFRNLFFTGPHQPGSNGDTPVTLVPAVNFELAANIVRRNPDFQLSGSLLLHLKRTIRNRERAQRWYSRLHPGDKRSGRQDRHLAFIEVLKRVYQTLSGGRAYSPVRRHRMRSGYQALVVVGSMLEQRSGWPSTCFEDARETAS